MWVSAAKPGLLAALLWVAGCAGVGTGGGTAAVGAAGPVPAKPANVWLRSMEAKRIALEKGAEGSGIAVLRTDDNQLQVNVPSEFSFDPERAEIKPDMRPVLDQFAAELEEQPLSHLLIRIVGYTDSVGDDAVNDALSLARAVSVGKYLESKGIGAHRIEVEGRGERNPMVGNDKAYGRALNRRVEIYLRDPGTKS
jgi:outer membrane protein OmpA-like peptidoglycan-associated protein